VALLRLKALPVFNDKDAEISVQMHTEDLAMSIGVTSVTVQ
jgi:hypothetical protein